MPSGPLNSFARFGRHLACLSLLAVALAGDALQPVHAHDGAASGDADEICELCVHAAAGAVAPVFSAPVVPAGALEPVVEPVSVAAEPAPPPWCRGPPRR
jgi:hypothetical protein